MTARTLANMFDDIEEGPITFEQHQIVERARIAREREERKRMRAAQELREARAEVRQLEHLLVRAKERLAPLEYRQGLLTMFDD